MIVTTPTTTTTQPSAFMTMLGHLKVSVEQEGLKLYHEAGDWLDHLSWTQVEGLLLPAIRAVAPGVLGTVATVAEDVAEAAGGDKSAPPLTTLPSDVVAEFTAMIGKALDGIRAEFGRELDAIRQQLPAAPEDQGSDSAAPDAVDPVVPPGEPADATTDSATLP